MIYVCYLMFALVACVFVLNVPLGIILFSACLGLYCYNYKKCCP